MLYARRILALDFLDSSQNLIVSVSILVVLLIALKNTSQVLVRYQITRFSYLIDELLGAKLFNGFLNMPYEWHLSQNSADIVLAVEWRIFLGSSLIKASFQILSDSLMVAFLLLILLVAQPVISIGLIFVLGCTAYFIYSSMQVLQENAADQCRKYDQSINRHVTKGIHGIKDLKVSGRIPTFLSYFRKDAYPLAQFRGLQNFYLVLPVGLLETVGFLLLSGTVCLMLVLLDFSTEQVTGIATLLAVAAWRVLPAMNRILGSLTSIRSILPYTKNEIRYLREIETMSDVKSDRGLERPGRLEFHREINVNNISFSYSSNKATHAIRDMSFRIEKGQTVGIVGSSGAGKSTIVDILIGLLPPRNGDIAIDDRVLDRESRNAWMSTVGYVPQSPYIFDGTLAGNVAFGVEETDIDRELVRECCRMAYMKELVDSLPRGIDTEIGERGARLSGGEKQRVAIARALYTMPDVIIFDEATSSLDSKSERAIQDTIYSLKGTHTLIIIAHRVSTIMECDFLVWIEKGRLRMIDTPDQVMNEYEYAKAGSKKMNNKPL